MNASRRTAAALVAGLLPLLSFGIDSVLPARETSAEDAADPFGLVSDKGASRKLAAAAEYAKEKDWKNALRLLQFVLDGKPDTLTRIAGQSGRPDRYVSACAEAERMLSTLPAAGREVYQQTYGPRAAELLKQARKDKDAERLTQIVQRYLYTDAGAAALGELARRHYRVGQMHFAALRYAKLFEHLGLARWTTEDLYHATMAFQRQGTPALADLTRKQLLARSRENVIDLGSRKLPAEELRKEIDRTASPRPTDDWPVYRGNAERSARGVGGPPFLVPIWRKSMLFDEEKENPEPYRRIHEAEKWLRERKQPILTAFSPITASVTRNEKQVPLVIYKNYWGIVARTLKKASHPDGQIQAGDIATPWWMKAVPSSSHPDGQIQAGDIFWASPSGWSLERMLHPRDARKIQAMIDWLNYYVGQKGRPGQEPEILFENSTVDTLSTDGQYVYTVEDLAVPPSLFRIHRRAVNTEKKNTTLNEEKEDRIRALLEIRVARSLPPGMAAFARAGEASKYSPEVQDAINHNRLQAYSLATNGKLTWELGSSDEKGPLSDCYFLGPPLPLAGFLYVLVEKNKELLLLRIDPDDRGKIMSTQRLVGIAVPLAENPYRRIRAAHLAYSDGILVCPTNAGVLVGVDLLSGNMVWADAYRESDDDQKQFDGLGKRIPPSPNAWKASAPISSDGMVVYAPPDALSLFCVNLRDGSLLWSRKKKDDELYLGGVYDGTVVIVGNGSVEGIRLASGESLWKLPTGLPSGQGIAAGDVYYVPLQESMRSKEPEICAIDIQKGRIVAHLKLRNKDVPGNLLFFQGQMLSVTPWEIAAYPNLQSKIDQINEGLARSANDPVALTERASLRRDKGELAGAIEDLRNALKNNSDRDTRYRARSLLFEALTELFRRDIHQADKDLKEYEELCPVDLAGVEGEERRARVEEERRRREDYFLLVATLRESQGRLKDALRAYVDFASLGPMDELIPYPGEHTVKVRRDVWVRGRIADLLNKATPQQRRESEEAMARRLKDAQDRKDVRSLHEFLAVCGDDTSAGREARLLLAEALMRQRKFLEAEIALEPLRRQRADPVRAARALEMLGRLMIAWELLPEAVYYHRILRRDFGKTVLPDGRTGANVWDALSTDKRLLPYLDEFDPFAAGRLKARRVGGSFPMAGKVFEFEHNGEDLPFFRRHVVGLQLVGDAFDLIDRATGEERWLAPLPAVWDQLLTQQANESPPMTGKETRFWYHTLGHLLVLPVADMVFAIDPVHRRVLWQTDFTSADNRVVSGGAMSSTPSRTELRTAARGRSLEITYPDGFIQFLAHNVVLSPSVLCLVTRTGLQAIEPLSGRILWTRSDLPARSRIFGDDHTLFVVEQDAEGKAISTRAFRLSDGATVPVPDFTAQFTRRLQVVGRHLLLYENGEKGAITLRLYDILTGADVWKQAYRDGSLVLHSEDPSFTGAVEPDGRVHVVDLRTGTEVMAGQIVDPKKDLLNIEIIHLLADSKRFYLACHALPDPNVVDVRSNLLSGIGLRDLPVNGMIYSFDRESGGLCWFVAAKNQRLILDQFRELPLLLLTALNEKSTRHLIGAALSIEKRSGKVIFYDDHLEIPSPFYAVRMDRLAGTVDFVSPTLKVTHWLAGDD